MFDCVFPSGNRFEIPNLDPAIQPQWLPTPLMAWGSVARTHRNPGTWHFYVDDSRFNNLFRQQNRDGSFGPDRVPCLEPTACVEPNISIFENTPFPEALYHIYRKRWMAKYWQTHGIQVFVDLNVPEKFMDVNLLGVPRGWNAYATRGYDRKFGSLEYELQVARDHSLRDDPLFLVVGGGKKVREFCQSQSVLHDRYEGTKHVHSRQRELQP